MKYKIWYSWYYEDTKAHAGQDCVEIEHNGKLTKTKALKILNDKDMLPCNKENVTIELIELENK